MTHNLDPGLRGLIVLLAVLLLVGVCVADAAAQDGGSVYLPLVSTAAEPLTQLPGDGTVAATAAIPELPFVARPQDYTADHPDLGGLMISFNTLYVAFTLDTTVAEANAILRELNATIVGGIPGKAGQLEGMLMLRLPTTTHAAMIAAVAGLRANPKVKIAGAGQPAGDRRTAARPGRRPHAFQTERRRASCLDLASGAGGR